MFHCITRAAAWAPRNPVSWPHAGMSFRQRLDDPAGFDRRATGPGRRHSDKRNGRREGSRTTTSKSRANALTSAPGARRGPGGSRRRPWRAARGGRAAPPGVRPLPRRWPTRMAGEDVRVERVGRGQAGDERMRRIEHHEIRALPCHQPPADVPSRRGRAAGHRRTRHRGGDVRVRGRGRHVAAMRAQTLGVLEQPRSSTAFTVTFSRLRSYRLQAVVVQKGLG